MTNETPCYFRLAARAFLASTGPVQAHNGKHDVMGQHRAGTGPIQHQPSTGSVLAYKAMFTGFLPIKLIALPNTHF